jgi:hypothetical protein
MHRENPRNYNSPTQKTNLESLEVKDLEFIAKQSLVPIVSFYVTLFQENLSECNDGKLNYVTISLRALWHVFENKHGYTDNVKLPLCVSSIPGGSEVNIDAVLTLAVALYEQPASCFGRN